MLASAITNDWGVIAMSMADIALLSMPLDAAHGFFNAG
jgi:hypothetical protein